MDLELRNKVIVVTGGTDGLGRALVSRLVGEGAHVVTGGRDAGRRERLADALPAVRVIPVDLVNPEERAHFAQLIIDEWGHIDALVNNAGTSSAMAISASTDDDWRRDYELKVVAAVDLVRRLSPIIRDGGSILNIVAVKGKAPDAGSTPTSASRAAGMAFTKALAGELAPRAIRVNALVIGLIESGQWERRAAAMGVSTAEFIEATADRMRVPLGRFGRVDEFADVASFLISARASYVTGAALNVDGGLSPIL